MNRGGLETMLMNYYRNIDRTQVQFDFLVHRQERAAYDDEIESLGGKIYRLPRLNPWSRSYLNALNRFFVEHPEYKIVHSHLDCMSAIPLAAAKRAGVPVRIAHSHSSSQDRDLKYPIKLYYKRKIPAIATDLFACGDSAGRWMFGQNTFSIINNAIDAKRYIYNPMTREKERKKLGIRDNTLVIGNVGRFSYPKNHDFLVEVFYKIIGCCDAVLLLVGDGELRPAIEKKVQELGIEEHVIFTGVRDDVPNLMQAMDVFVFPSHYEGVPVTLIEAQASGLPCMISDGVPLECKKTDLVQQISLSEGPKAWAIAVVAAAKIPRSNTSKAIKKSGYDIVENAQALQRYFLAH
ncbi:glycosyltransferase [Flavonifractor sp. An52]|nr:glycosyltransferase [Flavonifractor sp. An52]